MQQRLILALNVRHQHRRQPHRSSPLRRLRATFTSPCWLDQHCVRRAQPALQPAMLPAKQLRYDPGSPLPSTRLPRASTNPSCALRHRSRGLLYPLIQLLTKWMIQRSASTSTSAEGAGSTWKNNALPAGATIFSIGSVAWYLHLYGGNADAMTPAEEG